MDRPGDDELVRVTEPERLSSFVLGTCRLTVMSQRRTATRRRRLLEEFGPALDQASDGARGALDEARLGHRLERLSARERAVVVLTFYAERGAQKIARELGTSGGNIRVVRHRALARLRECLEAP